MIDFATNGQKDCTAVFCKVNFGTTTPSDKCVFNFKLETRDAHFAYLLAKHFQSELRKKIQQAHQKAYEIGYKDGRGKHRKKTNFDKYLGDDNPVY